MLKNTTSSKILGILLILLGIIIIIIIGGYLYIDKYILFGGSSMWYSSYLIYENFWYVSFLCIGLGVVYFLKTKKIRYVIMLLFSIIMSIVIYIHNTPNISGNYPLAKTNYYNFATPHFLKTLKNVGFSKEYQLDTISYYVDWRNGGKPSNGRRYPYDFYKTDFNTGLKQYLIFECDAFIFNDDNTLNKERVKKSKVHSVELGYSISKEKSIDSIDRKYKILKAIFYRYKKQFDNYYSNDITTVEYPFFRNQYNKLYMGKGNKIVVDKKEDMVRFKWSSNTSDTSITLSGSGNWSEQDLEKKENTTFYINEEDMYISISRTFYYK